MAQRHILCMGLGAFTEQVARLSLQQRIQVDVWDPNLKALEQLKAKLPLKIHCHSLRNIGLLTEALRQRPTLVAATKDSDEANLVTCQLVHQLGFNRSLAILSDLSYTPFTQGFGLTHAVYPIPLLLNEIMPVIFLPGTLPSSSFALGAVQMRTFCLPASWQQGALSFAQLHLPLGICIGCIRRLKEGLNPAKESSYIFIIPHGSDHLLPGDEVVCFGQPNALRKLPLFFGLDAPKVKSVVISGASPLSFELARFLIIQEIPAQYVEEDSSSCARMAEQYPECLVKAQSVEQWSNGYIEKKQHNTFFIACGDDFVTNLEQALLAKECGCETIVAGAKTLREKNQVQQLGMTALSSTQDLVAERVVSLALAQPSIRYWVFYNGAIVLMEAILSSFSDAVGMPLASFFASILKSTLILAVEHRGSVYIPTGETILFPGDRILLITTAQQRDEVLALFM